jgi:hypothetical protein
MSDSPETVLCHYYVRAGEEAAFTKLLAAHWPTLDQLGLVTDEPSICYQGLDQSGQPLFVEIFHWKNGAAAQQAHEHPEVMMIWEPMDTLCESRAGRSNMEFPHVERLSL